MEQAHFGISETILLHLEEGTETIFDITWHHKLILPKDFEEIFQDNDQAYLFCCVLFYYGDRYFLKLFICCIWAYPSELIHWDTINHIIVM